MRILLLLIWAATLYSSHGQTMDFAISVSGSYTTSSKIYPTPYSSDLSLRNNFFPIDAFYSPSAEFFWYIDETLLLGLSTEYILINDAERSITVFEGFGTRSLRTKEGFTMFPVELSLYYKLPFSMTNWGFYIYGGVALYLARYERELGNLGHSTIEQRSGYGIHVGVSGDYVFRKNLSVVYGMKFRDPQVILKSRYDTETFTYNNKEYRVGSPEFDSKINVDGVTFQLGLRYNFSF